MIVYGCTLIHINIDLCPYHLIIQNYRQTAYRDFFSSMHLSYSCTPMNHQQNDSWLSFFARKRCVNRNMYILLIPAD